MRFHHLNSLSRFPAAATTTSNRQSTKCLDKAAVASLTVYFDGRQTGGCENPPAS
jgi:hypothetical protein